MNWHVVADENIPGVETAFAGAAGVTRVAGRHLQRDQLLEAQVLLLRSVTQVNAQLLDGTPVKFVGTATSGTDHIDLEYLQRAGIGFAHAPGSNANSVVEYVLAAVAGTDDYLERLLAGGRVGIVGYGNIGRALAARLTALGIASVVSDPWLEQQPAGNSGTLEDVLSCEVVSLHPELTRARPWPSHHLLGEAELQSLGAGQLLVNASRGPVIDNQALLNRLRQASAPEVILDVWENEPAVDPDLLALVRFGTAHIAGYSYDGKVLATAMLRDAAQQYLGWEMSAAGTALVEPPEKIQLAGAYSYADALRYLLRSCYSITEDDRLLRRAVMGQEVAQARANFDQLRKQYRCRRELAGRQVAVPAGSNLRPLVIAMGCEPSHGA